MSQKNANTLKVVVVKVGEYAEITEIPRGLESLQSIVGGLFVPAYYFEDEVALIRNEEGKINGMPLNRTVTDTEGTILDVIAGDFLIIGAPANSEGFESLSDELAVKYRNMFLIPEKFYLTPRGTVNAYFKVKGKTPLSDENLRKVLQSLIADEDCSFEQMRQICNNLVSKDHLCGRLYLYDIVNEGIMNGIKVAPLLKSLETFEYCNLFYYDTTAGEGNSAYPVTDKVSLTAAILDELPLTKESHKQISPYYAVCVEEAEYRLNQKKDENDIECDADTFAYLISVCADALYEKHEEFLNYDRIDDIIEEVIDDHNRGCE